MSESNALTKIAPSSNALSAIDEEIAVYDGLLRMAGTLVKSGLLPSGVKTAEGALAIMLTGREFGWGAMKSFRNINIIHGNPSIKSDGMMGLVSEWCRKVGGDAFIRVTESTLEQCTVEYKRPEWSGSQAITYTIDDAKRAGLLGKDNWKAYPRDMLRARAQSVACRMGFADVVGGFYDPDEISASATIHEVPRRQIDGAQEVTGSVVNPDGDEKRRASVQRSLHGWADKAGLTHDQVSALARHYAGGDYASMSEIPLEQLSAVATRIRATFKEDPEELKAFAEQLVHGTPAEDAEVVEAEFTEPESDEPQGPAITDDRKKAAEELWRMAHGTWGMTKDALDEVAVALEETHLADMQTPQLVSLYRKLVVMSPAEREAVIQSAMVA
jgi:hypothetical protein